MYKLLNILEIKLLRFAAIRNIQQRRHLCYNFEPRVRAQFLQPEWVTKLVMIVFIDLSTREVLQHPMECASIPPLQKLY